MNIFILPDLGEGLTEAEIVDWHVAIGDKINVDESMVSVETAKAIVEIPAPLTGTIEKLFADKGDIVETGKPLVGFEDDAEHREDAGSVVGTVEVGDESLREQAAPVSHATEGVKVVPAVRALARRLEVDLTMVKPSGKHGLITGDDVKRAAETLAKVGPIEPLRGPRRAMAQNMALAHAEVVPATIIDDADINHWPDDTDKTTRLLHALVAGCKAEPSLNAWFESTHMGRRLIKAIDVGLAVDTPGGLFVPVLRGVADRSPENLREALEKIKIDVEARQIPPEEMRGYTITLSNFGMIAGKYAAPVVVPPTVAILGAGRLHQQVVAVEGAPQVHTILPLSLTFDHRAVTGGEAGRFLAAVIKDLEQVDS